MLGLGWCNEGGSRVWLVFKGIRRVVAVVVCASCNGSGSGFRKTLERSRGGKGIKDSNH